MIILKHHQLLQIQERQLSDSKKLNLHSKIVLFQIAFNNKITKKTLQTKLTSNEEKKNT